MKPDYNRVGLRIGLSFGRRQLSATIALSISMTMIAQLLTPAAIAQTRVVSPIDATETGRDPIAAALVAAAHAPSSAQAIASLQTAKRELQFNSRYSSEEKSQIETEIDRATQAAKSNQWQASHAINAMPAAQVDVHQLDQLVIDDPEIREALKALGEAKFDSTGPEDVSGIVKKQTGTTVGQIDQSESVHSQALTQQGLWVNTLKKRGLIKDFHTENMLLVEGHPGVPVDVLANQLISNATKWSAAGRAASFLPQFLANQNWVALATITGTGADALFNFVINVNLVLQLADLYGMRLADYDNEFLALSIFALSRPAESYFQGQATDSAMGKLLTAFGYTLGDTVHSRSAAQMSALVSTVMNHPLVAPVVRVIQGESLTPIQKDIVRANPGPATGVVAPISLVTDPAAPRAPTAAAPPVPTSPTKPVVHAGLWINLAQFMFGVAWSAAETATIGKVAKFVFEKERQRNRALDNEGFRNFLMAWPGEGFIKLLILSMNVGLSPSEVQEKGRVALTIEKVRANSVPDKQIKFILNLARSARICSPPDSARFNQLKGQGAQARASLEFQILNYACGDGFDSTRRFQRLTREFITFNEIPNDYIAVLRTGNLQTRLRMAEVLMQFRYLANDPSNPLKVIQFNKVITDYLQLTGPENAQYLQRLEAFITDHGRVVEDPRSPTGFSIGNNSIVNPYDLSIGYVTARAPDSPHAVAPPSSSLIPTPKPDPLHPTPKPPVGLPASPSDKATADKQPVEKPVPKPSDIDIIK
jgi:hypothetical protein